MVKIKKTLLNKDKQQQPQILKHYHQYIKKERPYNCHEVYIYICYLCARALVGVFPRLQCTGTQRRQLGLKHGDTAPGGRHELEGGLQRRAEGAVGLSALTEHGRQRRQQVLHQLQEGKIKDSEGGGLRK